MIVYASEQDIFRATNGLTFSASLARTLAYCLYWSQHATHWDGDAPMIWKTGPQLNAELRIAARTANRHFKELAKAGYWVLTYRPRPGTIGPVTWLTLTGKSLQLLETAKEFAASRGAKKGLGNTSYGHNCHQPVGEDCDQPMAQNVTSKKLQQSEKTAKKEKSFILPSEAGKKGMNETSSSKIFGEKDKGEPKAPGYVKATPLDRELAARIGSAWTTAGLKEWDWSSAYTWKHIAEVRTKLAKIDIVSPEQASVFFEKLLENWSWLRIGMQPRYAFHDLNLHAPSPMALAHEFEAIGKKVLEKMLPPKPGLKPFSFDDDL
ncbi:hypothetical protein [Sphingomonas sp. LT1P40]|uniref:hypothetical protein n=1 Tax=Alteristakelama amylovorans TaxID=3096166 RepID=UPI002FCA7BC2